MVAPVPAWGGVPVDSYHAAANGSTPWRDTADTNAGAQYAVWAMGAPHVPEFSRCISKTKAGADCKTVPVEGTWLCYGHWAQVAAIVARGMTAAAGHDPRPPKGSKADK